MNGLDKGLVHHRGRPLAAAVAQILAPQCARLCISANRNLADHAALLHNQCPDPLRRGEVRSDDPDLPPRSGPLAGIVTALRHSTTPWVMVVPCDTPYLPSDLVATLWAAAMAQQATVVTPATLGPNGRIDHHWACALVHRDTLANAERRLLSGERALRHWARAHAWCSVSFARAVAFDNFNTLETLNGRE